MSIDGTNDVTAAMREINATPVGEAGQFHAILFFRDDKQRITLIEDGDSITLPKSKGAAELVWLNLKTQ